MLARITAVPRRGAGADAEGPGATYVAPGPPVGSALRRYFLCFFFFSLTFTVVWLASTVLLPE